MRGLAFVVVLLLIAPAAVATGYVGIVLDEPGEVLVGYRHGMLDDTLKLVLELDGRVLRTNEELRFVAVATRSTTQFLASAVLAPAVEYAERNDLTLATGAQWNGAQWNGAQWNGAQWNSDSTTGDAGLSQWGLAAIRAPEAWRTTAGTRSAELCILDSGVAWDHPDLGANVWTGPMGSRGFNAIDPRLTAYDDAGHGTHMAGIAAGIVRNGVGGAGVANVTIMPVKVLASDGTGQEDDLAAGLVWCADRGADVALMALSVDNEGPTVRNALAYAASRDVLLVASAGNKGSCSSCVAYPARDANVVAVSAVDRDLDLASFSSQGPQVELAAPGVDVASTLPGGTYGSGSGTSQAAAFAAGAAALLRDARPDATAEEVRAALRQEARDIGPKGHDARYGHGLVDVAAALGGS